MNNRPPEMKAWIVWGIMKKGASVMRAICTSEELAKLYTKYAIKDVGIERCYIEPTKLSHLYLGVLSAESGLLVTTPREKKS